MLSVKGSIALPVSRCSATPKRWWQVDCQVSRSVAGLLCAPAQDVFHAVCRGFFFFNKTAHADLKQKIGRKHPEASSCMHFKVLELSFFPRPLSKTWLCRNIIPLMLMLLPFPLPHFSLSTVFCEHLTSFKQVYMSRPPKQKKRLQEAESLGQKPYVQACHAHSQRNITICSPCTWIRATMSDWLICSFTDQSYSPEAKWELSQKQKPELLLSLTGPIQPVWDSDLE